MDAVWTEEQELLREVARRLGGSFGLGGSPEVATTKSWSSLADAGLLSLRIPAEVGGGGTSAVEPALVAEMLGRTVSAAPYIGPILGTELLIAVQAPESMLRDCATGERRLSIAVDRSMQQLARAGQREPMIGWDAANADAFVVLDAQELGNCIALVSAADSGVLLSADLTRVLVELTDRCESVPIGGVLEGEALVRWEAFAHMLLCADMVGAMAAALEMAIEYAGQRIQFGRPIGSFQAVQHLAAEQYVSTQAARSITYYAAWAVDGLSAQEALTAAHTAKTYVSAQAREVTEAVMQILGGIGHTWEHPAHYFLRRVLLDRGTLGDESTQLDHLVESFRGRV